MTDRSLTALFEPKSIAVVGASNTPGKAGHEMLRALNAFDGAVYPVNPRETQVLGHSAYPNLVAIDDDVDLAILTLPAQSCIAAAEDAAEAGVKMLMIISGGFAETGDEGQKLQQALLDVCVHSGMRLLGPNTSGFATPAAKLTASFAPGMDDLSAGSVAIVAQSGAINLILCAMAADAGMGVSTAVGTGNGQNVSPADVIEYLASDEKTKTVLAYLEGVSDGRKLYDAISLCSEKKPVLIYTVGKADIGEFAASHTGNLMGSFELKRSALEQAGAIVVDSLGELINAAQMLSHLRLPPLSNPGVALLTGQAGPGMIISDYLRVQDVNMPALTDTTIDAISKLLPPLTFLKNPVDTGRPGDTFPEIMDLVSQDPNVDVLLTFVLNEPAALDPLELFSNRESIGAPAVFGTAGSSKAVTPTRDALLDQGIPVFTCPDEAARATYALVADAKSRFRKSNAVISDSAPSSTINVPSNPDEAEAKSLLRDIGIASPRHYVCDDHQQIHTAFEALSKPCVLKILSSEILHKTEVGGVQLHISNFDDLSAAIAKIDQIPLKGKRRYLLESMAPSGLELIIGGKRDNSFGPSILLGLGGTQAEAFADVALRLCPLSRIDAESMIDQLRGRALLEGWRGAAAVDREALIDTLIRLAQLIEENPAINEIDLNPVRIYPDGLLALDALIVTKETHNA